MMKNNKRIHKNNTDNICTCKFSTICDGWKNKEKELCCVILKENN